MRRIPAVAALLVKLLLIAKAEAIVDDLTIHSTYTKWVNCKGSDYTGTKLLLIKRGASSSTITEPPAVALHWTIDSDKSTLHIAVAAEASGWVGLGFSEMGGMMGSDIVVFFEASGSRLFDANATGSARPKIERPTGLDTTRFDCRGWLDSL